MLVWIPELTKDKNMIEKTTLLKHLIWAYPPPPSMSLLILRWCCPCYAATCLTGGSTAQRTTLQRPRTAAVLTSLQTTWIVFWATSWRSSIITWGSTRGPGWNDSQVERHTPFYLPHGQKHFSLLVNVLVVMCVCVCVVTTTSYVVRGGGDREQ